MRRGRLALPVVLLVPAVALAAAEALSRPAAKSTHALASAVDTLRDVGGFTEGASFLAGLDPALRETLERSGQVVDGRTDASSGAYGGYIKAYALFRQPKKRTYELLVEPSRQLQYLPMLSLSNQVERVENGELTQFQIKVLFTTTNFRVRHWYYPETSRLEWLLDPAFKNDIRAQEGFWQLFALDPQTTVGEYGTRVDTGLAVPASVQDFFARRDIPKALAGTRHFVDSNGTWKRDD
jgi:hypothetical protein